MAALTRAKNTDYAGSDDAFKNFRLAEHLGVTDTARGILVRMSDKFQRICNLIDRDNAVADEKIEDTLKDLAIYSVILLIFMGQTKTLTIIKEDTMDPTNTFMIDQRVLSTKAEFAGPKSELRWNPAREESQEPVSEKNRPEILFGVKLPLPEGDAPYQYPSNAETEKFLDTEDVPF